jgi:hypothetical protein
MPLTNSFSSLCSSFTFSASCLPVLLSSLLSLIPLRLSLLACSLSGLPLFQDLQILMTIPVPSTTPITPPKIPSTIAGCPLGFSFPPPMPHLRPSPRPSYGPPKPSHRYRQIPSACNSSSAHHSCMHTSHSSHQQHYACPTSFCSGVRLSMQTTPSQTKSLRLHFQPSYLFPWQRRSMRGAARDVGEEDSVIIVVVGATVNADNVVSVSVSATVGALPNELRAKAPPSARADRATLGASSHDA